MTLSLHLTRKLSEGRFAHDPYNPATVTVSAFAAVSPQTLLSTSSQAKYAVPAMCTVHALRAPPATAQQVPAGDKSSIYFPCDLNGPDENFAVLDACSERPSSIYSDTHATVPYGRSERSSRTSSLTSDAPTAPDEHIPCRSNSAPPAPIFTAKDESSLYFPCDGRGPTENGVVPGTCSERPSSICSDTRATVPYRRSERSSTTSSPSSPQLPPSTSGHANPVLEVHSSPLTTSQAKDVPVAVRSIFNTQILNAHGLRRCPISQFVPERSLAHAGGDLRTYAQHIDVRNIPTGRRKLAGQVCEDLLSYIIGLLFWDEAKPEHPFVFLETNLKIQVSKRDPTSHVAEVVFSWSHSQGPAGSSFANITLWLSKTLRTGIKNFGRRYRVLFDVDGVIWWGKTPTNAAAHWEDLDRYLKENAELRQDETKKERSRRFGWMPLSYLIIKCHYVEPTKRG